MPRFRTAALSAAALAAALAAAGCSIFDSDEVDPIFADAPTGPNTEELIETLPKGLGGDSDNRRYSTRRLRAEELDPADGGGR